MYKPEEKPNYSSTSAAYAAQICNHLTTVFTTPTATPRPLYILVDEISAVSRRGGKIFVYGVGREGLMLKAVCMRLFHLGLPAHCVFDMTTPPIASPDLLIASAGPGGFATVDAICGVARDSGARVLLLTAQPETSASVKHASAVAHIPAQTMADDQVQAEGNESGRALLPMGSVYEGAMFVLFEMVVYELGPQGNTGPTYQFGVKCTPHKMEENKIGENGKSNLGFSYICILRNNYIFHSMFSSSESY